MIYESLEKSILRSCIMWIWKSKPESIYGSDIVRRGSCFGSESISRN